MLSIRIQVLIWFSCAVLLRQNHGFTPTPRAKRRATLLAPHSLTFYPPRASLTTKQNDVPVYNHIDSESCQDGERHQDSRRRERQSLPCSRLVLTACGVAGSMWTLLCKSTTKSSLQARTRTATAILSFHKLLVVTAAAMLLLLATLHYSPILDVCTSMARQAMSWYFNQLHAFPLVTKSITSGFIGVLGDYAAQWLEYRLGRRRQNHAANNVLSIHGTYHYRRGLAILVDGMCISGPIMHWGYDVFEQVVPTSSNSSMAAMIHVLADTLLLDSIFVATAIIGTGLVEGYSLQQEIIPQLKRDYVDTLKAGWATSVTLVPLGFMCFRCFPLTVRTVVMNLMDILWDGIVSFMAHKSRQEETTTVESTSTTMLVQEVKR